MARGQGPPLRQPPFGHLAGSARNINLIESGNRFPELDINFLCANLFNEVLNLLDVSF